MTVAAVVFAYVLGSLPTGLWLGLRFRGVDIRERGSRNIGATNTLRVLGKGLGAVALVGDMAKGAVPVLVAGYLSPWEQAPLVCGLAAIAGHTWSVFLKFRGGKGVATSAGVFLSLAPVPTLIAVAAFLVVLSLTRMVSASSITSALVLVGAIGYMSEDVWLKITAAGVGLLVIVRHRTNVARILKGEEPKIGQGKDGQTTPEGL